MKKYEFEHHSDIYCCAVCPMEDLRFNGDSFCRETSKDIACDERKPKWCPLKEIENFKIINVDN